MAAMKTSDSVKREVQRSVSTGQMKLLGNKHKATSLPSAGKQVRESPSSQKGYHTPQTPRPSKIQKKEDKGNSKSKDHMQGVKSVLVNKDEGLSQKTLPHPTNIHGFMTVLVTPFPCEILFRVGSTFGMRKDFEALCPRQVVEEQIFTMMACKATWMQHHITTPTIWSLPPSFSDDILKERALEQILTEYCKYWMEPFSTLKFVYLSLKDETQHWFLAVISIYEKLVYHLDCDLLALALIRRWEVIRTVLSDFEQVIASNKYPVTFIGTDIKFDKWEIVDAKTIPQSDDKNDSSAVWVMEWVDMEHAFQPNIFEKLDMDLVRMRTTINLITGDQNELRKVIEKKSEEFWLEHGLPHP
ncbi:Papain-like cysteine peptidase superfamily [Sesbania bispinosa]|nr:Papain-like cysteine peptidase superfamily [Sesbania bispinosa]